MELAAFQKDNGQLSVHLDEFLKKMNVERQPCAHLLQGNTNSTLRVGIC